MGRCKHIWYKDNDRYVFRCDKCDTEIGMQTIYEEYPTWYWKLAKKSGDFEAEFVRILNEITDRR